MATLGLGVFFGGIIVGVPVVTGVAQGVQHQKEVNAEAANETRMVKFNLEVFCGAGNGGKELLHGNAVVLRDEKVWIVPKEEAPKENQARVEDEPEEGEAKEGDASATEGLKPKPLKDGSVPHPFTGFYIMYPDDDRSPAERGLVSTISEDPPMLNWLYVDNDTHELRHGNRTQSLPHMVGPWDWTEDEKGLILDEFEGFVAVKEDNKREDGLEWAIYYDRWDDDFGNGRKVGGKKRYEVSLDRKILAEELIKAQALEQEKKLQVKSSGDLKTQWDY